MMWKVSRQLCLEYDEVTFVYVSDSWVGWPVCLYGTKGDHAKLLLDGDYPPHVASPSFE